MLVIGPHWQTLICVWAVGADSISARNVRVPIGASGTPPPTNQPYVSSNNPNSKHVHTDTQTQRPPCVKGAPAKRVGDCDLAYQSTCPRVRPNPSVTAAAVPPAYASGPSVAARHLPALWGVTLYTREALVPALFRGGFCVFSQILQKTKG